jgi:hypothetical protein
MTSKLGIAFIILFLAVLRCLFSCKSKQANECPMHVLNPASVGSVYVKVRTCSFRIGFFVAYTHYVAQACSAKRGDLRRCLRSFGLFTLLLDERTALLGEHGHIRCGVADRVDGLELLGVDRLAIEERWLEIVDHDVNH